ncbi:hypothetical protein BDA96_06G064300 [Sorghum bicolor]|uniref:Uncharacterized protein n=2 Tax=Sorghum bicolor TaxID=4558 RepID=A0A921QRC6_SORBI|nr:hypothetical protein BDA96_06G064300 [Sorghum bicolor]KAG0525526.1 hypothetical protein BDA96_06G064300 [Sorghum bicolor]KXG26149.1 hypothetical protein SORBI_3006G057600 [Sorghum bicolor]OQU81433.1 hypothetical protein SORBI_3006G057600 [Sorghum bicolor]
MMTRSGGSIFCRGGGRGSRPSLAASCSLVPRVGISCSTIWNIRFGPPTGPHIDEASRVALDAHRFGHDGASSDCSRPPY